MKRYDTILRAGVAFVALVAGSGAAGAQSVLPPPDVQNAQASPSAQPPTPQGEIVITGRRQHGQLILAHVTAAGLPLDAVIDTGSEVTIGNLALRDKLIRTNPDKFANVQAIGVTGEVVNLQVARIGELRLGSVVLRDVPIAFADVTPFKVFGLDNGPALLLGTDILETFRRVSLDFRARKVRFQLRHCDSIVSISAIAGMETTHLFSTTGIGVCES